MHTLDRILTVPCLHELTISGVETLSEWGFDSVTVFYFLQSHDPERYAIHSGFSNGNDSGALVPIDISSHPVSDPLSRDELDRQWTPSGVHSLTFRDQLLGFVVFDIEKESGISESERPAVARCGALISQRMSEHLAGFMALSETIDLAREFLALRGVDTQEHMLRVSRMIRLLASLSRDHFGLSTHSIDWISRCGPIHDIGKIAIPDHVLTKPTSFEPDDLIIMREHVLLGVDVVRRITETHQARFPRECEILINVVKHHHERLDGSGYPMGLKADEIPPEARITTVIDIFDALLSPRFYKEAWPVEEVMKEMQRLSSISHIDNFCFNLLVDHLEEFLAIHRQNE